MGATIVGVVLTGGSGDLRWLFLGLPVTLALFVLGRLAPTGYRLAADGVHVQRRAGRRLVIPYRAIRAVDRLPRPLRGLSLTASRGIFGHFGTFWNTSLGIYRVYITNSDSVVWLDTVHGWVAVSPDRPDEFVDRLRARLAS